MRRHLFGAALVAVLCIGLLAPPASAAGTVTAADPAGDGHGVGDVRALRYSQNGNSLRTILQVRLQRGTSRTAPTWTNLASASSLRFNIATDGGPQVDYVAEVVPSPTGAMLEFQGIPRGLCGLSVTFPQPEIIRVAFENPICFGDPDTIRVFSRFRWDRGGDGTIDSDDRAPNAGYAASLPITLTN
jgi:hypothetical protein